jgi:hypothetical protein
MGAQSDTAALRQVLTEMQAVIEWPPERRNAVAADVSAWSPARHVEHLLIALRKSIAAIDTLRAGAGGPILEKGRPTVSGRAILMAGRIPRGRAEAPDFSLPSAAPAQDSLRESLAAAHAHVERLAPLAETFGQVPGVIEHPVLKGFRADQWWRFARVHSEHHLGILRDVDAHVSKA